MTGAEALNVFTEWARTRGVPFAMRGNRLCGDYETVTVEFFRTPEGFVVRVIEGYGGNVRWAERLTADGAHVVRTRTDEHRPYNVVCPGWRAALADALETAYGELVWWHHSKSLF